MRPPWSEGEPNPCDPGCVGIIRRAPPACRRRRSDGARVDAGVASSGPIPPPRIEVPVRRLWLLLTLSIVGALLTLPAGAMASGSVSALTVNPSVLNGGGGAGGAVALAFPDAGPTVVRLSSTDSAAAQVPFSFTIPAGQTTGTF